MAGSGALVGTRRRRRLADHQRRRNDLVGHRGDLALEALGLDGGDPEKIWLLFCFVVVGWLVGGKEEQALVEKKPKRQGARQSLLPRFSMSSLCSLTFHRIPS